ncbi:lipid-A-disaccharide synthase [Alisedimentitalea sp. MJ-SS2]|uniref:lipid-A-disaccharide synthase n=1 Tax=Aliisedimentitalea sp. MJ-SS2 TaxID=3049795 RepID=UPI00290ECE60|nr:lipid-A-disaccharide synthase [Alisedimentitalea sp. MJ-SS2]MDU8929765.1 lipid-A-disaccharide synthase [Alisedimentitalea sp. MJ-SS2]
MKVYLIAGELSGDKLGGALMAGLKELAPDVEFKGVGGPRMAAEGLESLFSMDELSVMGLAEVLPRLRHLFRRRDQVVADVLEWQPDVMVTIDSPDFCLRVAKKVKPVSGIRTVHYVAPSVWAWRAGRAAKMARHIDQVLALLPFEPPYMQAAGMECDFVGHPVVSEPVASEAEATAFRDAHGIDGEMLLILPGSRRGEVSRLAGRFGQTLEKVVAARPGLRAVIPAAPPVAAMLQDILAEWPGNPVLLDPRGQDEAGFADVKRAAFRAADTALAASGTVSLELAAAGTPMVIGYDMGWLSRQIIPRMLKVDTVTLVSLVSETRLVPEFIGKACQPAPMAEALLKVLDAPEAQREALELTMERLGRGSEPPGLRAARAVLGGLS